jgi:hypothetical protein
LENNEILKDNSETYSEENISEGIKCAGEPTTQHKVILVLILVKKTQGLYYSVSTL